MNQQRSRRFRASKEAHEKNKEIKEIRSTLILRGATLPPEKPKEELFDSNCITPVCIQFLLRLPLYLWRTIFYII